MTLSTPIEDTQGASEGLHESARPKDSKSLTNAWLEGAHYRFNPMAILPYLDVYVPNSATEKEYRYRGKKQCDLIQCLLDELKILGETEFSKRTEVSDMELQAQEATDE